MRVVPKILVVLSLAAAPAVAGTLRGRILLVEKGGKTASDLADAVVWVEGPQVASRPSRATITMKDKAFAPRVAVVTVGGSVEFPNQDPVFHNVFSVSGENRFDLELYKKPKSGAWVFRHPGLVRVYCNIHPQMSAYVLVRDNPFWARPSESGAFEIPDVPPGAWVLKAWHERAGEARQAVTVAGEETQEVLLTLDASKWKPAPHKNKFGQDYRAGERY
jgi:plastocyanin